LKKIFAFSFLAFYVWVFQAWEKTPMNFYNSLVARADHGGNGWVKIKERVSKDKNFGKKVENGDRPLFFT